MNLVQIRMHTMHNFLKTKKLKRMKESKREKKTDKENHTLKVYTGQLVHPAIY